MHSRACSWAGLDSTAARKEIGGLISQYVGSTVEWLELSYLEFEESSCQLNHKYSLELGVLQKVTKFKSCFLSDIWKVVE